jgi:hypothetical protein
MLSQKEMADALNAISEADDQELANIGEAFIERLGDRGRAGAEALLERIRDNGSGLIEEGLAQIESVEGVYSGRTDAL